MKSRLRWLFYRTLANARVMLFLICGAVFRPAGGVGLCPVPICTVPQQKAPPRLQRAPDAGDLEEPGGGRPGQPGWRIAVVFWCSACGAAVGAGCWSDKWRRSLATERLAVSDTVIV